MNLEGALQLLREAGVDEDKLSLAGVELALAAKPQGVQDLLREVIQAAALPHWFDDSILWAILSQETRDQLNTLYPILQSLPFVEPFSMHKGFNIHEKTRLALLRQAFSQDKELFRQRARAAFAYFQNKTQGDAFTIEASYHQLVGDPSGGAEELSDVFDKWYEMGRVESLQALALMLEEHLRENRLEGLAFALALDVSATVQLNFLPVTIIENRLRTSLKIYQKTKREELEAAVLDELGHLKSRQGHLEEAMKFYQASLAISESNYARGVNPLYHRRNVAISKSLIGNTFFEMQNIQESFNAYMQALKIREELAASHPESSAYQRDLSETYDNLGEVALSRKDLPLALHYFQLSFAISEKLSKERQDSSEAQHDLGVSFEKLARVHLRKTLASLDEARRIYETITERASFNLDWWQDLGDCYNLMAEIELVQDNKDEGRTYSTKAENIFSQLITQDKENTKWSKGLMAAKQRITRLALERAGHSDIFYGNHPYGLTSPTLSASLSDILIPEEEQNFRELDGP
jgi:tetratricopeptide (TPR) repeat protein